MSEERLQEIKDSIEFQYTLAKAKGYENALLFTNEEEELIEEIERLNNIINELEKNWEEEITRLKKFIIEEGSLYEINNIRKMLIEERENDLCKLQLLKKGDSSNE